MRKLILIFSLLLSILGVAVVDSAAYAGELKTITLSVEKMTCNICPFTVKKALKKIEGVTEVSAKYEGDNIGWARVTYDPSVVGIDDLTFATEMAGYPSHLKQQ